MKHHDAQFGSIKGKKPQVNKFCLITHLSVRPKFLQHPRSQYFFKANKSGAAAAAAAAAPAIFWDVRAVVVG